MSISPLPQLPQRNDPITFADRGDAFIASLPLFATQLNTLETAVIDTLVLATIQAVNASVQAVNASNSAILASGYAAAVGATIWVSGTTYAVGDARYSPINFLTYRRTIAGAGTIDPSLDSTNWVSISGGTIWAIKSTAYTAIASEAILMDTSASALTLTLPSGPQPNTVVRVADYMGTFSTNNLTIGRNGAKIMGLSEDMIVSRMSASFTLTYINSTRGWMIL